MSMVVVLWLQLQMLGYDISWAAFNIIEVMSSAKFTHKVCHINSMYIVVYVAMKITFLVLLEIYFCMFSFILKIYGFYEWSLTYTGTSGYIVILQILCTLFSYFFVMGSRAEERLSCECLILLMIEQFVSFRRC